MTRFLLLTGLAGVIGLTGALTPTVATAAARCKPGEQEDPATGECRPREAPKKPSGVQPAPPAWGDSPEEKERKAELHKEICEKQCERDRGRCRDTNCDEQNKLCLELCFKSYLLELPGDRAAAVQAQEFLRPQADAKLTATQKAAAAIAAKRDRCRTLLPSMPRDQAAASQPRCDSLARAVDEAAPRTEAAQKARLQFDAARKELEVKKALDQLERTQVELEKKQAGYDALLEPVEAAVRRWAAVMERVDKARQAAAVSADAAARTAGDISGLVQKHPATEGTENEKAGGLAGRQARDSLDGAARKATEVKSAPTEAEGMRIAREAEKLAQDAADAASRAAATLDAERKRQAPFEEAERKREEDRRAREQEEWARGAPERARQEQERQRREQEAAEERRRQAEEAAAELPQPPVDFGDLRLSAWYGFGGYSGSADSGSVQSNWQFRIDYVWSSGLPGIIWALGLDLDLMQSNMAVANSTLYTNALFGGVGYGFALNNHLQIELMPYAELVGMAINHPYSSQTAEGAGGGVGARLSLVYTMNSRFQIAATGSFSLRWYSLSGDGGYKSDVTQQLGAFGVSLGRRF